YESLIGSREWPDRLAWACRRSVPSGRQELQGCDSFNRFSTALRGDLPPSRGVEAGRTGEFVSGESFVHLHTHSEFSLLDGASRVDALFERAAQFDMPALALTDHGVMFGALDFYEAGVRAGVKPILGVEAYVAPGSRFDRAPGENEEKYRHLTILASDETGYRNLPRLVTDAALEGFYHRPRIDKELLAERSE